MIDFKKILADRAEPGYEERRQAEQRQWEADREAQLAAIIARLRLATEGERAERAIAKLSDFDQRFIQSMARECDTWDMVTTLTGGKLLHLSDRQRQNFDRIMANLEGMLGIQSQSQPAPCDEGGTEDSASSMSHLQRMLQRQR